MSTYLGNNVKARTDETHIILSTTVDGNIQTIFLDRVAAAELAEIIRRLA